MCHGCWTKQDAPTNDTPAVRAAANAIEVFCEEAPAGDNLHVVVDDWNLDDRSILWCLSELPCTDQECRIARMLLSLTDEERGAALALAQGFWEP